MDVREKLVEILKQAPFEGKVLDEWWWEEKIVRIVDHLIARGVTVQEWISTNDRMPTEDDAANGYVPVIYARADGVNTKTISLVDVVIKHPDLYDYWMPLNLPQPRKQED